MPQTLPKHTPYAAWLAGLTLLPEEMEPTRRDAARAVLQNQQAAERFATGRAPQVAMVPQPCQQQQAQAGVPVWIQTNAVRSDLTGPRGIVLGSIERKAGQWNADKVPAHARSRTTRTMLGAYPTEAEARTAVEQAVGGPQPPAPRSAAATAWGARMDEKHPRSAPRPPREDSPAMKAALAIAADAGRRYGEAQLEVRAKHDIAAAPARAGRYGRAA